MIANNFIKVLLEKTGYDFKPLVSMTGVKTPFVVYRRTSSEQDSKDLSVTVTYELKVVAETYDRSLKAFDALLDILRVDPWVQALNDLGEDYGDGYFVNSLTVTILLSHEYDV